MGPTVRGIYYGYYKNYFGENIWSSSSPTSYTSSVEIKIIESQKNIVSKLIEEIVAQRERTQKKEEKTTSQIRMLQEQFCYFIQSAGILPPSLGDAVWDAKGLGLLDKISTDEQSDRMCATEDAEDEDEDVEEKW